MAVAALSIAAPAAASPEIPSDAVADIAHAGLSCDRAAAAAGAEGDLGTDMQPCAPGGASANENRVFSGPMSSPSEAVRAAPPPAAAPSDGFGGFLSTIFVVASAGAVVFGVISSGSGEPLLLTLIAVLAMLGLFLLFAIAAGHVRIGARRPLGDVLRAAFDASAEPVMIADGAGAAVYWNGAFDANFGRSEAGPYAALENAVGAEASGAEALFRLTRAAERGEARFEDFRIKGEGFSAERALRISVQPFFVAGEERRERLAHWRIADVTEEAVREAGRLRPLEAAIAAFDRMPAGFVSVGPGGVIAHVNATFESWLGHAPGALRAGAPTIADLAGAEGARQLAALAGDPNPNNRAVDLDLKSSDGRIVPLTLLVEATESGFSLTAINRAAMPAGAGAGDARIAPFFQSAPFGIATIDAEGRLATCNTAFARLVLDGRPANGAAALDALAETASAEERAELQAGFADVLAGRSAASPVEITAGAQKQFTRRVYMAPIVGAGAREAAALYVLDVTDQKGLEARFAQAQKMEAVGKLAGGIAHDFNNVLTAIIGFCDLMLQTHRPTDPDYKDIKNIQSAANRAAGLVASLLGFSRKQTQQVAILNLAELAADMSPVLKTLLGEKIELKTQSDRDLWYVRADRDQIFNVMLNLARNARDAMAGGGKLSIRTRNVTERESQKMSGAVGFTPGEYVLIEVADTGAGMSPEVMAKIFEPFFTTKAVGKGTGLGLASVYGIVKQSGGFIQPESTVGEGTTFKVFLPRYALDSSEEVEVLPPVKPAAKRRQKAADLTGSGRVLLVEDESDVRQFAVRALKRLGYHVLEAADGVEALDIMSKSAPVDIVVSDVVMPEMDGPTLFKELRQRNPDMKVIFVSGYPNEAFREQMGGDDFAFLPKPFSMPQLAAKVKEELAK